MTIERFLQTIGTPCRLPVPGKIMFRALVPTRIGDN
jgi:hypothetical protein